MIVEIRNKYTQEPMVRLDLDIGLDCIFINQVINIDNKNFLKEQHIEKNNLERDIEKWITKRNLYKSDKQADIHIMEILDCEDNKNYLGRMKEFSYMAMLLQYFDIGDDYVITPVFDELVCFLYLNPYLYKIHYLEVYCNDFNAQKCSCS